MGAARLVAVTLLAWGSLAASAGAAGPSPSPPSPAPPPQQASGAVGAGEQGADAPALPDDAARDEEDAPAPESEGAPANEEDAPAPDGEGAAEDEPEHEGLLPFLPKWVPLGPVWQPEPPRQRPPSHIPETMVAAPPLGSEPKTDMPLPEEDTWTLVPVPIVYADPNLGFGIGLMPVLLMHPEDRIEWIVAPSLDYNELLGVSATSRIYFYPTLQEELFIYNDMSTEGKMEHEARFHGRDRFIIGSDFYARGYFVKDPTRRFFGLGANTREDDESDYEITETAVESDIGYRFTEELRLAATFRYRASEIDGGIIDDFDDTVDVFPDVGGVAPQNTTVFAYGGRATLDLRDDPILPSKGLLFDVFGEVSVRGVISSTTFTRWGGSVTGYWPFGLGEDDDFAVSVGRFSYHEIRGDRRLPFFEMPTLGGRSRLRGFGVGRFTDEGYLLIQAEERLRVYERQIMSHKLRLEVAAFLDIGRVFGEGGDGLSDNDWQYVPGLGVRILIPQSGIIARGDIGFGGEGPAIFLVLGYPF